mgnify:CR=1 FL=1
MGGIQLGAAGMNAGWWNPNPGHPKSKYHYVNEHGTSLCRRWQHLAGSIEQGNDLSPDNCAKCKSLKAKLDNTVSKREEALSL